MTKKFTTYPKNYVKANSEPEFDVNAKSNYARYIVRVYKAEDDVEFSKYDSARQYAASEYDKMGVSRVQILDSYNDNALLDEWINEPEEVE